MSGAALPVGNRRARRLLARTMVLLGGTLAATAAACALSGTASADELRQQPAEPAPIAETVRGVADVQRDVQRVVPEDVTQDVEQDVRDDIRDTVDAASGHLSDGLRQAGDKVADDVAGELPEHLDEPLRPITEPVTRPIPMPLPKPVTEPITGPAGPPQTPEPKPLPTPVEQPGPEVSSDVTATPPQDVRPAAKPHQTAQRPVNVQFGTDSAQAHPRHLPAGGLPDEQRKQDESTPDSPPSAPHPSTDGHDSSFSGGAHSTLFGAHLGQPLLPDPAQSVAAQPDADRLNVNLAHQPGTTPD